MKKIKCEKCGSENVQEVSFIIDEETGKKDHSMGEGKCLDCRHTYLIVFI